MSALRLPILAAALVLAACAVPPTVPERRAVAEDLAARQGWKAATIATGSFAVAAWLPPRVEPVDDLTIYIEGDGLSWLSSDMPSDDPTPLSPLGLRLALAQPTGSAAYLARPCQFVRDAGCARRYWTTHRFAPEVVSAMSDAVDEVKRRLGAHRLTLVGYSGGGAVAALLAARRNDVVQLVTIAGNLDHGAWTRQHRLPPLTGSFDAADARGALASMPQWHFVGARDENVPPNLTQAFADGMPAARVVVVPEYDHRCCWAEDWRLLWKHIR